MTDKKLEKAATRDAYGKALAELGRENKNIVVLDADLSGSTRTAWFAREFPDRFFNAGIAEQNMIGLAAGLAVSGKIAFASTFAMFATGRCWEQIRNTVGYPRLNVKVVASHAGVTVGEDGASHQAIEDIALMRAILNMRVIVPADAEETKMVIRQVAATDGPFYVRLSRSATPAFYAPGQCAFRLGKGSIIREGRDAAIVACGIMVYEADKACAILAQSGISVRLINMASITPLDHELLAETAQKCGRIVTCEEHSIYGGLGSAVAESVAERYPCRIKIVGVRKPCQSGAPDDLLKYHELTAGDIARAVKETLA
ncbi:MAG: transketolase family protein [Candidatus Margulisbacteria bacterium]|jgi:transketolase|nr:transketolase family protein [Candidatus Margulisiibacteriota bacterium]